MDIGWIALVVSLASAVFSGWQAVLNAQRRKDEKAVTLLLRYEEVRPNRTVWELQNTGAGSCHVITLNAVYKNENFRHEYTGHLPKALEGKSTAAVTWNRELPAFEAKLKDRDYRFGDHLSITAIVAKPGSSKRIELPVALHRQAAKD